MYLNATLIVQIIVFLALWWFTARFVWPPITKALDERSRKIADGLAAADKARLEAAAIIAAARKSAEDEAVLAAQKARDQLRDQVAQLAVAGAERILRKEVDATKHADILANLKNELK